MFRILAGALLAATTLLACSSADKSEGSPSALCENSCAKEGESSCEGDAARTCARSGECLAWTVTPCAVGTEVCRAGACATVSQRQRDYSATVASLIDEVEKNSGLAPELAVDVKSLKSKIASQIFHDEDAPRALFSGVRSVLGAYPSGHLSVYSEKCIGFESMSALGACAQPYGDHAVISAVVSGNPLALVPGDEVLAVDGTGGEPMLEAAYTQPICGTASASPSNRRYVAATSLFALAKVGTTVRVRHIDGKEETRTVSKTGPLILCRDPFMRQVPRIAEGYLRPDGIGVIQVQRLNLGDEGAALPLQDLLAAIRKEIKTEFDKVKGASGIVWDFRANEGGSTLNGLEVVAGIANAAVGFEVGGYRPRNPGGELGPRESIKLSASSEFAYAGKVAFLMDGLSISAADYTLRGLALGAPGVPRVGAPTAGAYGGARARSTSPAFLRFRCIPIPTALKTRRGTTRRRIDHALHRRRARPEGPREGDRHRARGSRRKTEVGGVSGGARDELVDRVKRRTVARHQLCDGGVDEPLLLDARESAELLPFDLDRIVATAPFDLCDGPGQGGLNRLFDGGADIAWRVRHVRHRRRSQRLRFQS